MAGEERSTFVGSGEPSTFVGSAARRLPRILVKIAAYRDPELPKTIRSALANADRPERLRFVIVNQHDLETDEISLAEWSGDHRFRVVDVHFTQTLGLGWARYTCDTMWRGEEFTLQIDSHMRFDPGWDSTLLDDWTARDDPRAVLTAYPRQYEYDAAGVETHEPAVGAVALFVASVNDEGESTLQAQTFTSPEQRLLLVAGGFQLAPGIASREVPNDRRVQYGDELIQSLRFFVAGYNVYSPHSTPLAHFYGRAAKTGARLPVDDDVDEQQTNVRAQFRQRSIAACRSIMFGEAEPRVARRTRQTFFHNLTGYMRTPWPGAWPDRSRSDQLITASADTHTQENNP